MARKPKKRKEEKFPEQPQYTEDISEDRPLTWGDPMEKKAAEPEDEYLPPDDSPEWLPREDRWQRGEMQPLERVCFDRMSCLYALLCSLIPPLGAFMLHAEREERGIRHFAAQSVGLTCVHLLLILLLLISGRILVPLPYFGLVVLFVWWVMYFSALTGLLILRIRMMRMAYKGLRYDLPVIGRWLGRLAAKGLKRNWEPQPEEMLAESKTIFPEETQEGEKDFETQGNTIAYRPEAAE